MAELIEDMWANADAGALFPTPNASSEVSPERARMLEQMSAFHLEMFARTFKRYTRSELADITADVAAVPGAADAVASQFIEWEAERVARARAAEGASAQRAEIHAAISTLIDSLRHLVPLILRRLSARGLRQIAPRAPSPARLT